MLQWLMKGLGMTKKKLINLSKGEETINSDCQSIEEPKGWRFNWRKVIPLEPTAELIILVLLALLYGGFYYYDHYTVNEDNIYGLWQSDHHKLAISYKHIRKRGNIDWQVVQMVSILSMLLELAQSNGLMTELFTWSSTLWKAT